VGDVTAGTATGGVAGGLELGGSAEVVGATAGRATGGALLATAARGVLPVEDADVPDNTPTTAATAAAVVAAATRPRRRFDMRPTCPDDLTNE
jgi:hypothetical protein